MKVFDNIIVGLDISKNSINVLQRAFLLAKDKNSKVTIVHAIDSGWLSELFSNFDELKEHAIESIKKQMLDIDTKDVEYEIVIDKKAPSTLVIETAKNRNSDLIIIGANEENTNESAIVNQTAHKIAQGAKLPMFVVKNSCSKNHRYNNIVSFSDLSKLSLESFVYAKEFFNFDSIKVVYAYKQMGEIALRYYNEYENKDRIQLGIKNKEKAKFDEFIKENSLENTEIIENNVSINNAIINYVDTNKNDLVVLGSKGVNNTDSFIFGSTTSFLMENIETDLLIYISK